MAVVIRFTRRGTNKKPMYRVVAADKHYPRDGRYLEILGTYNPKDKTCKLDKERVQYWLDKGATPSLAIKQLMQREHVLL